MIAAAPIAHGGAIVHARFLVSRLIVLAFAFLIVAGCGRNPVIGILLPMTGEASGYGDSMKEAIDLAGGDGLIEEPRPKNEQVTKAEASLWRGENALFLLEHLFLKEEKIEANDITCLCILGIPFNLFSQFRFF